jgi:hypothetical protein
LFFMPFMRTRGDMLRFALAFALRSARKLVRGLRHELTETERFRVADDVVPASSLQFLKISTDASN